MYCFRNRFLYLYLFFTRFYYHGHFASSFGNILDIYKMAATNDYD